MDRFRRLSPTRGNGLVETVADKPGNFHACGRDNDDQTREVDLVPFYRLHRRTYAIYWDLYTAGTWKQKLAEVAAERERQRKLEAATISSLQPGDTNKEKEFNQQGEETTVDRMMGRTDAVARNGFLLICQSNLLVRLCWS
jgi:hypothetical protein